MEYLLFNNIIHRDKKPEIIVLAILKKNNLINNNYLYLINFGESDYIGKNFKGKIKDNFFKKENKHFMAINTHKYGEPCSNDDIESLVYSLLYITKKGLLWDKIKASPSNYDKTLQRFKEILNIMVFMEMICIFS